MLHVFFFMHETTAGFTQGYLRNLCDLENQIIDNHFQELALQIQKHIRLKFKWTNCYKLTMPCLYRIEAYEY